jgi:hypothetical protein
MFLVEEIKFKKFALQHQNIFISLDLEISRQKSVVYAAAFYPFDFVAPQQAPCRCTAEDIGSERACDVGHA